MSNYVQGKIREVNESSVSLHESVRSVEGHTTRVFQKSGMHRWVQYIVVYGKGLGTC